jgi:hypothetical protein
MKLRIRGNSIRLRLGEREVAKLVDEGRVSDSIRFSAFPAGQLTYTVITSPDEKEIAAGFAQNEIRVTVPEDSGRLWANSELVGLNRVQQIGDEISLSILIEKDFRCLAPRPGEDESDSFANPADGEFCDPD